MPDVDIVAPTAGMARTRRRRRMPPMIGGAMVLAMAACHSSPAPGTASSPPPLAPAASLVPRQPSRTATNSYPAMASLLKPQQDGDRHACGAGLVSRTHVITAAHRVTGEDGALDDHTRIRVRIGSAHWRTGGLATGVAAVNVFPAWRGDALHPPDRHGDLALLRLAAAVDVPPFPLASTVNTSVSTRMIGWGIEVDDRRPLLPDGDAPPAETLHEIDGMTATATQCAAIGITDAELCVAFDGPGTCGADSGSPALQKVDGRWHLLGVLSHSYGDVPRCERAFPRDAFTDLTDPDHRAWITRIACARTLNDPSPCGAPANRAQNPNRGQPVRPVAARHRPVDGLALAPSACKEGPR